jgi:hypothetical protein
MRTLFFGLAAGTLGLCCLLQAVSAADSSCSLTACSGNVDRSIRDDHCRGRQGNGSPSVEMAASMGSGDAVEPAEDNLSRLDNDFRHDYAEAKRQILEKLGPVIVLNGDLATLYNGSTKVEEHITPALYTLDKTVDHIPLAIYVILTNVTGSPFEQGTRKKLTGLQEFVHKAIPEVKNSTLPGLELSRQQEIIDKSLAFIDEALSAGRVSEAHLREYTRKMAPLTMQNVDEATAKSLSRIDEIVQKWRKDLPADRWNQLYVVVVSGHMPREQNSFMQYFQMLLHQKQEGERIIYFEGAADDKQALDLLVTHILDRRIGIDFYDDPWRMHRDLLSDGARKYLEQHSPADK